jgi:hypothetical protein
MPTASGANEVGRQLSCETTLKIAVIPVHSSPSWTELNDVVNRLEIVGRERVFELQVSTAEKTD